MRHITLILSLALAATITAFAQKPSLKIYSGKAETATTATQTIVGVTNPGATATINGQPAKVYKTGSFGLEVPLSMGANQITVEVKLGKEKTAQTFTINRVEAHAKPAASSTTAESAALPLATPMHVTTTEGAYLQYGDGNDRLGGSKMGFLAAGIPLKLVAKKGDLYKAQLSTNRYAYIEKDYVKVTNDAAPATVVTGSWAVTNNGKSDRVSVSLPCKRAYSYRTLLDPSAIVVELYGAMDNSNWITQRTLDLGIIDYVNFCQVESDVYQVIIYLKEKYQWGFTVGYEGNMLTIDVRHCPENLALSGLTIGLDAGHGGTYSGAVSPSGVKEKDVNLDIVRRLKALLEKNGAKVVLTRSDDTGPSMAERKRIFRKAQVDLAISVHNNAGGSALSSPGTSTYYKHLFDRPLAECILKRMLQTGLPLYGLVGNFNFSLNGPTDYPNALVEGMFMSSLEEEEKVADPEFRQLVAEKILLGLQDYLSAVKRSRE